MILSDVNIIHRQPNAADGRDITDIFVGSREEAWQRRGESVEWNMSFLMMAPRPLPQNEEC